ncbi:uncharacterized protein BO66DRAFT_444048 [Aspergillus aculeatinus CBS 121060]|uniref:Uncharacterized protein n=2 Tax=Aspergillus aculeatinus CBS 121060 TaxID=1448322 RepID=A0ACD1GSV3_9EURO|nr:hypothetical protein BO66DRAFT_444041 [Aspergillus aculeatinus CBS 121060]XP_025498195.1 hypothetical protein BO66DRAFT_444048 [Aspergillus aculeatinus CBS 121060]RAH64364.1 hypothetical protein BO66DRAFT_444041 [Aspergillus aculeatinus CBS 121060]RAH64372.1 hypothetical protein BO66DRAFT_444048 [Aspergillus aculeatinus CBS 121060]
MADTSFTINLIPTGDENDFRTKNEDGEVFRAVMVSSPNDSTLSMRGKIEEIHHGQMTHEGQSHPATLLLFDFRFQSEASRRRYCTAKIVLEFFDQGGVRSKDPIVVEMAPTMTKYLNRTSRTRETKNSATASAQVGQGPFSSGLGFGWEVQETRTSNYSTRVSARPWHSDPSSANENAVIWSMEENGHKKDGVPSFLQTAVLIRRSGNRPFMAKLRVDSKVDFRSTARRIFPLTTDVDHIIDPVTLMPDTTQVRSSAVTGIREDDLQAMEKLPIAQYFCVDEPGGDAAASDLNMTSLSQQPSLLKSESEATVSLNLSLDNGTSA